MDAGRWVVVCQTPGGNVTVEGTFPDEETAEAYAEADAERFGYDRFENYVVTEMDPPVGGAESGLSPEQLLARAEALDALADNEQDDEVEYHRLRAEAARLRQLADK